MTVTMMRTTRRLTTDNCDDCNDYDDCDGLDDCDDWNDCDDL